MRNRLRRTRRPLIALVVLVAALIVAYVVKGLESDHGSGTPFPSTPAPATSRSPSGSGSALRVPGAGEHPRGVRIMRAHGAEFWYTGDRYETVGRVDVSS